MNKGVFLLLLCLMPASLPVAAHAAFDGFCIYSSVKITAGATDTGIRAVAVQPWDGKVVIGGEFTVTGGNPKVTLNNLARINSNGTLDVDFAPSPNGEVRAIVIPSDQSGIYIGGSFSSIGPQPRNGLARLGSGTGTLDGSFDPATPAGAEINAISLQPGANSVVVGGQFTAAAGAYNNVARISIAVADAGALTDSFSFGTNGVVNAILVQDGMIVIGGNFTAPGEYLARYHANGVFDGSFLAKPGAAVRALALQADGMILVGGDFTWISTGKEPGVAKDRRYLARLTGDGELDDLDPGLDDFDSLADNFVATIAVQPDGRILVGGDFTKVAADATTRSHAARFKIDLSLDPSLDPKLDAVVNAIALQPDGKFLTAGKFAAAGVKPRTMLARFYYHGALDDDAVPLDPSRNGDVMSISLQPDGSTAIAGFIPDTEFGFRVGKLKADLSPDDSFDPFLSMDYWALVLALQTDGNLIAGGWFEQVVPLTSKYVTRLNPQGKPDPAFAANVDGFLSDKDWAYSRTQALAIWLPKDALRVEDFMIYVGGYYPPNDAGVPKLSLARTTNVGVRDTSFQPALPDGIVYSVALQSDDKVLVAGGKDDGIERYGTLVRFHPNGDKDDSFTPPVLNAPVYSVGVLKDGRILIAGSFTLELAAPPFKTTNLARLNSDGSIDTSLQVNLSESIGDSRLYGVALQADGNMLIYGQFDRIMDGGTPTYRDCIARIDANGKLDGLSLFAFNNMFRRYNMVTTVHLQQDGKILAGGGYTVDWDSAPRDYLSRFANGWATQELTVAADLVSPGKFTITWKRAGTGPELWGVIFEESDDPENGPWNLLGRGKSIDGGWELGGQSLVRAQNRYLRARGYLVGSANNSASLTESVRLYYLDQTPLTITVLDAYREYGAADPAMKFRVDGLVNGDTVSGITVDSIATASSPAGSHHLLTPREAVFGSGSSDDYRISYQPGTFTISPAPLTISAENKSRPLGTPNPVFTATFAGLASFDSAASLGGLPSLTTVADAASPKGSYTIVASRGSISSTNYSYFFVDGVLSVIGATPQAISFDPMRPKTFGDGDFDPGGTASSGLPVDYASSAPGIASVIGGKIRVLAPGTTDITAAQSGNEQYSAAAEVTRTLVVNPPPWNGLGFDGADDLMRVEDAPQLNFGGKGGFSIETWLHLDGSQPDGTGVVSKGGGGSPWSGYQLILHRNRIAAEIGGGSSSLGVAQGLVGTGTLNDGQWHHVALSLDRTSATASLYLDGRLEAQVSNPVLASNSDNADALQLGTDRSGSGFFKGEIDELRVWDSVRSRDEIRGALSQIIDPLDEPHLAAYFHFDEGDVGFDNAPFAAAPERTAHGAHGALHGFALSGAGSNWIRSGAFLPLLETAPVSQIGSGSAAGGGTVYPNYYPATEVGLCWGRAPTPGLADSCSHSRGGTGAFAGVIIGLAPGATYYVRGFATNLMGTAYGNEVTFQAARLDQTISIGPISDKTYGAAGFTLDGTTTSGLPITYTSSNPDVAIVVNGEIEITGAGSTVITASQGGNETYGPASDVPLPLTVAKAPLTVTADSKSRAYLTPNPILSASYLGFVKGEGISAISGTPALLTAASQASPAAIYDIVASLGTLAAQNYSFVMANGTLSVFKSCQEILFPPIGERTFGDPPREIVASACSGLGISFTSSDAQVARISGNTLVITGAGSVVITASQSGNDSLDKAPDVSQTVIVQKSGQGLNFSSLAQKVVGDPPFTLAATSSSGLPVSYQSSDPGVATLSGNTVTVVGAGTTVITANQVGNANYHAALPVSQPLTVAPEGVPPLLYLSTLSFGAVTSNPVLNIVGRASDASGIASLTVNGADLTGRSALFSSAVPLGAGENRVSVSARDGAGNKTTQTFSITLDPTAPALALDEPADNSVTNLPFFTASGRVAPGSAVTIGVNGAAPQLLNVAEGGFTASGYLEIGVNTIELSASLSGRGSRIKRSVTLAPDKPPLAITEPVEDIRTEQESLTIRGRAGGEGSVVTVTLDAGASVLTPPVQAGAFEQLIALNHAGENRIVVSVTDSGGNTSFAQRNIIRVDRIMGDLNGDGRVEIQDAAALLRISLGTDPVTAKALAHGDVAPLVNGVPHPDGKIDVGDVLVLLRKIVGMVDF